MFVIETETIHRPPGYKEAVTAFLQPKGYKEVFDVGRNTWYQHDSFTASRRPQMRKSVFNYHQFRKGRIISSDSESADMDIAAEEAIDAIAAKPAVSVPPEKAKTKSKLYSKKKKKRSKRRVPLDLGGPRSRQGP